MFWRYFANTRFYQFVQVLWLLIKTSQVIRSVNLVQGFGSGLRCDEEMFVSRGQEEETVSSSSPLEARRSRPSVTDGDTS